MEKKVIKLSDFVKGNEKIIEKQTGRHAVRPFKGAVDREDGFVNLLTNYGTQRDSSEAYVYQDEGLVPDDELERFYEGNGLFSRIIDLPAEEAIKHGFEIVGLSDGKTKDFYYDCLDELDWEENAMLAIKWARLFGGSLGVLLVNDGRGLEEPLDWDNIKSLDEIRVFDRSLISPDYTSINKYESCDPFRVRGSRLGMPETYMVTSKYGTFTVHDSRCLVFQNGVLPERAVNSLYQLWGIPEYIRIHRAIKDVEVAHGMAPKMLDRSVQAIYKMSNLAMEMATEDGEANILKRLQLIDMARGLLNSIVLDAEGEDYDFKSFSFTGVSDVINTTCNYLSAITNIPQTVLFGRSPAGMNATGTSDLENYYNYVERIQKRMVKSNLRYLLAILSKAGLRSKEIDEVPSLKVEFNSLWSMSEQEKVALDLQKAQVDQTKANTASVYVQMQAIDPTEVRKKLAEDGEFDIDTMLDDYSEEELEENNPANKQQGDPMAAMMGMMGGAGGAQEGMAQPEAPEGVPEKSSPKMGKESPELQKPVKEEKTEQKIKDVKEDEEEPAKRGGVGVIVVKDGKILTATRIQGKGAGLIGGPGGHIEEGERPEDAAVRETIEEFQIKPKSLLRIGDKLEMGDEKVGGDGAEKIRSTIFLCTDFEGEPDCDGYEMALPVWRDLENLGLVDDRLFKPFKDGLDMLKEKMAGGINENKYSWDSADDEEWITVKGNHVLVDDEGKMVEGPKELKNVVTGEKKPRETKEKKETKKSARVPKQGEKPKSFAKSKARNHEMDGSGYVGEPCEVITGKNGSLKPKSEGAKRINAADAVEETEMWKKTGGKKGREKNSLTGFVDENGNLTPERQRMHDEIIQTLFKDKTPYDGQASMVMSGGGTASGKSFIRDEAEKNFGKDTTYTIDPDDFKAVLAGYTDMAINSEDAASFYHEESSALAKRAYQYALDNNINVVYDGTGDGSVGSVMKKINSARDAGYKVDGKYVTVDVDGPSGALVRNQLRYEKMKKRYESGESDIPPRKPKEEDLRAIHRDVSDIVPSVYSKFDTFELWDSNVDIGEPKILVATCTRDGEIKVEKGRDGLLDKFLQKGEKGYRFEDGKIVKK